MKSSEYSKMADAENFYWWHVGRKKIINKQLKKAVTIAPQSTRLLNIGCGTGGTIPMLSKFGSLDNVEVSQEAIDICRDKGFSNVKKIDGIKLPFKDNEFDIAVALDVLEHIEDDSGALKEWHRILKKNGRVFITVPAYQWLWSEHDESLHHHRRYTLSGLHKKLNRAGFRVQKRTYAIVFSFPLIVGYRFIKSILPKKKGGKLATSYVFLPNSVNLFFIWLLSIEAWLLQYINAPFGTSLLIVAEKK